MQLSAQWIREFVDVPVDDHRLAEDLTSIGIAIEGVSGESTATVFEMEIGTNRPDAMNHYGVAREAAALYGIALKPIETSAAKAVEQNGEPNAALKRSSTQKQSSGTAEAVASRRDSSTDPFSIEIEDKEGCARYTAQIIRGAK